ncbi:MAG TPA: DUF962 domain-containing protein [Gemmataceae bacterium]|nr:DUF962 domain-containing protein [Gemmataceae bacterium]
MTFTRFYADIYLPRHADPACKWLHLIGVPAAAVYGGLVAWLGQWWLLVFLPVPPYLLGFLGHVVAHNQPTTFRYPLLSILGYGKMLVGALTGRLRRTRSPAVAAGTARTEDTS